MADFKLKRGYNIKIAGQAEKKLVTLDAPKKVAVLPNEFPGIKPRLNVAVGDKVKVGSVLFEDKQIPELGFVSPVSGEVIEINRGERRVLREIVVENDNTYEKNIIGHWTPEELNKLDREEIKKSLLNSGMWPHIIQRPFSKIANFKNTPRDIFISGMDTSPLAADPNFMLENMEAFFQTGLGLLGKLTDGSVHLSITNDKEKNAKAFENATGVEKHRFSGPHPAGNVGVQIHHVKHIARGEIVWIVKPYAVALIGKFFTEGYFQSDRIVATAGSSIKNKQYYKTIVGAPVNILIPENEFLDDEVRLISGNVLTGRKISSAGYVSFYDNLITGIPEGSRDRKIFGYFRPGFKKPSYSKTFLSNILSKNDYVYDTLVHGGERAFVATGDYESVLPMDIYPVYLAKSIMAEDIEEMEGLGILELDEEDVALCSYICLSKTDFGKLVRQGLELIEREG